MFSATEHLYRMECLRLIVVSCITIVASYCLSHSELLSMVMRFSKRELSVKCGFGGAA